MVAVQWYHHYQQHTATTRPRNKEVSTPKIFTNMRRGTISYPMQLSNKHSCTRTHTGSLPITFRAAAQSKTGYSDVSHSTYAHVEFYVKSSTKIKKTMVTTRSVSGDNAIVSRLQRLQTPTNATFRPTHRTFQKTAKQPGNNKFGIVEDIAGKNDGGLTSVVRELYGKTSQYVGYNEILSKKRKSPGDSTVQRSFTTLNVPKSPKHNKPPNSPNRFDALAY